MMPVKDFYGSSVIASEEIVSIVGDYLSRVASIEKSLKKKHVEKADALTAINSCLREKEALPWHLDTFWYGPGRMMKSRLADLQTVVSQCDAAIEKDSGCLGTTLPKECCADIANALVLTGDYRFCVIEKSAGAIEELRDTLTSVLSTRERFDNDSVLRSLSHKTDAAFDRAADPIKELRDAICRQAFDFALGKYERDAVLAMAATLKRGSFDIRATHEAHAWLFSLRAGCEHLRHLSMEYVKQQRDDAIKKICPSAVAT